MNIRWFRMQLTSMIDGVYLAIAKLTLPSPQAVLSIWLCFNFESVTVGYRKPLRQIDEEGLNPKYHKQLDRRLDRSRK